MCRTLYVIIAVGPKTEAVQGPARHQGKLAEARRTTSALSALCPLSQETLCLQSAPAPLPFRWEAGYWHTMDIAHDRAGYYLCWGCLNWVPAIYTSPVLFLTEHQVDALSFTQAAAIAVAGAACVWINYDSDKQKQVRFSTDGRAGC